MRFLILTAVSLIAFFTHPDTALSQSITTNSDSVAIKNALNIYHQYMKPEPGLYDGSEYTYNTYYPFIINEGDPFFFSKNFYTGSVYYNGIVYEKVPLLYDIIHGEVLIRDPSQINIVRLNDKYIGWFTIYGHTFNKLIKDSTSANPLNTGFYAVLNKGKTSLYKSVSKIFKENSASFQGLNKYTVETDEYFIKILVVNVQKTIDVVGPANDAKYDIDFFPEGGNLVENIPAKVAFKGVDQYGRGINFKGDLLDNNDTVLSFMPLHAGIGTFSFTPVAGHVYKTLVTTDAGGSFSKVLPTAYKNGYVMNLVDAGNEIEVTVHSDIQAGREVYLFVQANGIMQIEKQQTLRNGQASFKIDKKDLGDGISYFTIFNDERKPVTERLYFKRPSQTLAINISPDQPVYGTRKKINLNISLANAGAAIDTASLSISVYKLDSLQSKDVPDITAYLLLNSELAGYVENPGYYFTNNNTETNTALDNIMLTHGWRRFKWEDFINNKKTYFEYAPEFNGPIFTANVINTITGKPAPGIDTYLSVQGLDAAFTSSVSDGNGLVKFELKKVYGPSEIILQPNTMRDSIYRIDVGDPYSNNFSGTSYPFLYVDPATENPLKTESVSMQVQNIYAGKKLKEFASPNIDTTAFYANADGKYLLDNYTRFTTIEEVLREYVAMADVRKRDGSFHYELYNNASGLMLKNDPLLMLDGIAVFDFNKFMEVDPLKLYKLEVLNRRYFLGNSIFNGILNWTSYECDLAGYEPGPHATIIDYDGLQAEREFYSPSYATENERASHIPDFRNVLQWTPTLKLAPSANKMIEFYSSDLPGKYVIDVQGISKNGIPGSKTFTFEIKR